MAAALSVAKLRWKILGEALRTGTTVPPSATSMVSVRRFEKFGLFHVEECLDAGWFSYSTYDEVSPMRIFIRNCSDFLKADDLIGFNNTGNICVWPSEEVLSYYSVKNADIFTDKNVCELGGGMTCLAGLTVGVCSSANRVLLTDGNPASIKNVEAIVEHNRSAFGDTFVEASVLRWGDLSEMQHLEGQFDLVLCADCLFFKDMVESLLQTIYFLLKSEGTAVVLAPSRGDTFSNFATLATSVFKVTRIGHYDDKVQELHEEKLKNNPAYNQDLHFPLMLQMQKPKQLTN